MALASVAARSWCAALGTSTLIARRAMMGAVAMKMMSTTRMMSTDGVTLIAVIAPSSVWTLAMFLALASALAHVRHNVAPEALGAAEQVLDVLRVVVVGDDAGDGHAQAHGGGDQRL